MLDRTHIEKILRMNGVDTSSADDEIKSVLLRARWNKDDVETALVVLREDKTTHEKRINTLHKVFRSDDRLAPEMVASLLGVSVDEKLRNVKNQVVKYQSDDTGRLVIVIGIALITALALLVLGMWQLEVGPFHAMY